MLLCFVSANTESIARASHRNESLWWERILNIIIGGADQIILPRCVAKAKSVWSWAKRVLLFNPPFSHDTIEVCWLWVTELDSSGCCAQLWKTGRLRESMLGWRLAQNYASHFNFILKLQIDYKFKWSTTTTMLVMSNSKLITRTYTKSSDARLMLESCSMDYMVQNKSRRLNTLK